MKTAAELLAQILFEELDRLAPGSPDLAFEWDKMPECDRLLYVSCVNRLLEERDLICKAILEAACDSSATAITGK